MSNLFYQVESTKPVAHQPTDHPLQMRLPACLLLVLLLVGSSSAGLLQNVAGALECPQNLVVVNKINDKAFMQQQIRCILGETDEECNEVGKKAKCKIFQN